VKTTKETKLEPCLELFGFTKEELQERLLDRLVERFATAVSIDDEGDEYRKPSPIALKLQELVKKTVEATIAKVAEKHLLPNVKTYVETLTLQETNKWGEKTGKKLTFTEYLVERAESYMTEKVNHEGKAKDEVNGYSWNPSQTRVAHMIHQHLQYSISSAMERALKSANSKIVEGLVETVKIQLAEVEKKLKVRIET